MRALPYVMIATFAVFGPAQAEEAQRSSGRYALAPSEQGGFIRLDTETGAMSHCGKREGIWRCDVLAEDSSALQARIDALQDEVGDLRTAVEALTVRIDAMTRGQSSVQRQEEMDQALGFTEQVMRRFFDMVREMKRDDAGRT
jgi:hypothetical protein